MEAEVQSATAESAVLHPDLVTETLALVPRRDRIDATELEALARRVANEAAGIEIVDDVSFAAAGERLRAVKTAAKRIETARTAMKAPYLEGGKAVDAFFRVSTGHLADAETILKRRVVEYQAKVERERRAAEEAARIERERVEAERLAAEAAAAAERAKRGEPEVVSSIASASLDDLFGDAPVAASVPSLETSPASSVSFSPIPPAAPQLKGVSSRGVVKARVVDIAAIAKAAAEGDANALAILAVNQSALNGLVKAHGRGLAIPGVEVFDDTIVSARGA